MDTLRGLLYIKHGRIGTRSEGPDYYLQTAETDYTLQLNKRELWERDYELEFYGRRIVIVTGEPVENNVIQVSEIQDTGETLIYTEQKFDELI